MILTDDIYKLIRNKHRKMIDRCNNPQNGSYKDYGGRGIKVCFKWRDFFKFAADLPNDYFEGAEIDRIDNNGNYEPGNIRWATRYVQARNRRSTVNIEFKGKEQCLTDWASDLNLNISSLTERIEAWGIGKALTTPKGTRLYNRWDGHVKSPERLAALAKPKKILNTVEYNGKIYTIAELSIECGISIKLLNKRIFERKWTVEKAVETGVLNKHECAKLAAAASHKRAAQ
jgi:hypothetical protein